MNHILTILYLLTLCTAIFGKAANIPYEDDYPRYAYNYAINDPYTKDIRGQWGGEQLNGDYALLEPDGNLRVSEFKEDFSALNAIVQKLGASLSPLSLFGPLPPVNPLIDPLNYGFGAASLPITPPKVTVRGSSIPWDPKTRSYGGWVPLRGPVRKAPLATIVSRKYVNGQLYKVKSKPIYMTGKTILIKRKVQSD